MLPAEAVRDIVGIIPAIVVWMGDLEVIAIKGEICLIHQLLTRGGIRPLAAQIQDLDILDTMVAIIVG
jgi:hypothetical protein